MANISNTQENDFPQWYQEVIQAADLAENGPAKGQMIIKPWAYFMWETIQSEIDKRIKASGHENFSFPTLIPQSLLAQEEDHLEGFVAEVATVTQGGGKELDEPLALRPTSETIIWNSYKKWIKSYRDLPLLYNQWGNVFRWEKRTRLFLRTSEFLWQEGHTAHETSEEATSEATHILNDVYEDVYKNVMMMAPFKGRKSESERFPGAVESFTLEAMMRDKKALQSCTSHYLGDNFARAYDVQFQGRDKQMHYPFGTSWGISTRSIGGVIMSHGDDAGLILPSKLASKQVVIVPIFKKDDGESGEAKVLAACELIAGSLKAAGVRTYIDDRDLRPGNKYGEWEVKGVPIRIEVGPRDLANDEVTFARRDLKAKTQLSLAGIDKLVVDQLAEYDQTLYDRALAFREENTIETDFYDEMRDYLINVNGFVIAPWNGKADSEAQVKEETKATTRCLLDPKDYPVDGKKCAITGEPATEMAVWAVAY